MHKDTMVGILGAVILVAAMVGIFYYEGTQVPNAADGGTGSGPLAFVWSEASVNSPPAQGSLQEGQSTTETLTLDQANLTRAVFVLTWSDDVDNSQPDTFRVTVTAPDGTTYGPFEDGDGEVRVEVSPINPVPDQESGTAADLERLTTTAGTGAYNVTIELVNAGDIQPVPGVPPTPVTQDTGNSWSLAAELSVYEAQAE